VPLVLKKKRTSWNAQNNNSNVDNQSPGTNKVVSKLQKNFTEELSSKIALQLTPEHSPVTIVTEDKKSRHVKQPSEDSTPIKKDDKKAKIEKEKTPTASNTSNVNWAMTKTGASVLTKSADKRLSRKLLFQELQKARTAESKKGNPDIEEQVAEIKIALEEETKNRIRLEFLVTELLQRLDEETKRRIELEAKLKLK